jgi:hypothetical protein
MRRFWQVGLIGLAMLAAQSGQAGEESYSLKERFPVGYRYRVKMRVELSGTLTPPAVKGKPAKPVKVQGESAIDYDECVLKVNDKGDVSKTVRFCQRLDFRRTLAGRPQELSLRPGVRRLVVLRRGPTEVPFSPDGPLTWGEIDAVRTDVFAPALAGLLPDKSVRVGDRWQAKVVAVQELTDLEKIEDGRIDCRLERIDEADKQKLARVSFSGAIRGVGEDGPVKHRLEGAYQFDLSSGYMTEVSLTGTTILLDPDGKETGRIEGRFVMVRSPGNRSSELTEAALKRVKLDPDAENTLMLYDNPALGLRFQYPRRWRVAQEMGPQVALDGGDGSGILVTVDPLERIPSSVAFMAESRGWLEKQKAKLLKIYTARKLVEKPALEAFALEAEMNGQRFWMDYYVTRQDGGGATLAARLMPGDLTNLRKEVDRIARSVVITKKIQAKK